MRSSNSDPVLLDIPFPELVSVLSLAATIIGQLEPLYWVLYSIAVPKEGTWGWVGKFILGFKAVLFAHPSDNHIKTMIAIQLGYFGPVLVPVFVDSPTSGFPD
jgi:hypothetical protein